MSIRQQHIQLAILLAATVAVSVCGAWPYAGGWNDGSRLAAVEALADHGTFAIDNSIFVRPENCAKPTSQRPYPTEPPHLLRDGTKDKLCIAGEFYSDKPYSVSLALAGVYRCLQFCGLPRAAERPDLFCWWMTLLTSGVSYIGAVWCMSATGRVIGLPHRLNLLWTVSFAFSTYAATYSRHVNSHVMLLAVVSAIVLQLARIRRTPDVHRRSGPIWLGLLGSAALCLDPGSGPVLLVCLAAYIVLRFRSARALLVYGLATSPLVLLQLGLNYRIGGVVIPTNMVAEYSNWPGSAFDKQNLTGFWRHTPGGFTLYAASMLFGKRGIVGHNLPLFLLIPAVYAAFRQPLKENWETWTGFAWCAGTWLLYAALSNNSSGACCSIRWFVPFLAPAYFLLGQDILKHPHRQHVFAALSLWGGLMAALMWWHGPWWSRMVPGYWSLVAAALLSWRLIDRRATAATITNQGGVDGQTERWNHDSRIQWSPPR